MMTVDEALMKADDANYSSEAEITLAAEVRRLQQENKQLRKDAAVSAAIERAAADLPYGDMLEITVEKGSAMVVLYWGQCGFETMDVDDDNRLSAEINAAIDAAIDAARSAE
jgi:hypothetical protein